jgi:hypothetical protein
MSQFEGLLNNGSNANTAPYQRWAQAIANYLTNGVGTPKLFIDLWKATGEPMGSALSQWAIAMSLSIGDSAQAVDRARLLEQKEPIPGGEWVDQVSYIR